MMTLRSLTLGFAALTFIGGIGFSLQPLQQATATELIRPQLGQPMARVVQRRAKIIAEHPALRRSLIRDSLVFVDDIVKTDDDGYLRLSLIPGGELRIGPNTRLTIATVTGDFRYPRTIHLELDGPGAVRYLPDPNPKADFPPYRISIKSPAGTVTGSASDFWVGWLDQSYTVLLHDGSIEVATLAGARTITEPGEGVKMRDIALLPPEPVRLRDRQLARIEATITPRDDIYY